MDSGFLEDFKDNNVTNEYSNHAVDTNKFIRKCFLYMIIGLIITSCSTLYLYFINPTLLFTLLSKYFLFIMIGQIVLVLVLSFTLKKLSPMVIRLLYFIYTAVTGVTMACIGFVYEPRSVLYVLAITVIIFVVLAVYGYTTKEDLSSYRGYLLAGLVALLIISVINIFLKAQSLYWIISVVGVVLFTVLIAYDVNRIKNLSYTLIDADSSVVDKLSVMMAFNLYLDFINLFLYLLRFFGRKRR